MVCSRVVYKDCFKRVVAFAGGVILGQLYYYYLLKQIPFPRELDNAISLTLSAVLGLGNAVSTQLRCVSMLLFPMYCGKPGRGVLKAVILTYIVTGPITNMGLNAREVVRVFACSTQLSANISREKFHLLVNPVQKAIHTVEVQVDTVKHGFRKMKDVLRSLQLEIEDTSELKWTRFENTLIDHMFHHEYRLHDIDEFQLMYQNDSHFDYNMFYRKKLQYRCDHQFTRAEAVCTQEFTKAYKHCTKMNDNRGICRPLKQMYLCNVIAALQINNSRNDICYPPVELSLGIGYAPISRIKNEFVDNLDVQLQNRDVNIDDHQVFQNAKEASKRVVQAFEEKTVIMQHVLTIVNVCVALLFLRIFKTAVTYHDMYLTSIDYDNVYITGYFKRLNAQRNNRGFYSLLPLKKMERLKYIDVYSLSYKESQRSNLLLQILKVMLEVITATTFVMLDRMFFEALEVVRLHAETNISQKGARDLDMQVQGTGILAETVRSFLSELNSNRSRHRLSNAACLPHPRQMPYIFFLKIYGGYLWIILLLFASPYTLRLKRLICNYFYPKREKQRILHLFNDILKKRMKMHKTLRRIAVQAVRAHYLSGETLLSVRMKFPRLLGWLQVLPAARMACLICGETEPRTGKRASSSWYSCLTSNCPFVYCAECWREVGARCLACEPGLAELSDVDSLTDTEPEQIKE